MNILVLNGHPNLTQSVANACILALEAEQPSWRINSVTQFDGDTATEQQQLLDADVIVVQFPLYWSTYPAVLKHWIDEVFTYGFAFGPNGSQLQGKPVLFSITAGATEDSYSETGFNFLPFNVYQQAYEHPFRAAAVEIIDTIISFEMNSTAAEGGNKSNTLSLAKAHAERVIAAVNSYKDHSV
jgi:putative NADPH-quinone reductase